MPLDRGPLLPFILLLACDLDRDGIPDPDDCDDRDAAVFPGAVEVCNGIDDDCDGVVDPLGAVGAVVRWPDADGDGFGASEGAQEVCPGTAGWSDRDGDCDDGDPAVSPDAKESCNGIDDDCDGVVDPHGAEGGHAIYPDRDGDGLGDRDGVRKACSAPPGWVEDGTDCDDDDPEVGRCEGAEAPSAR